MISDPTALQEICDGWDFVCRSRNVIVGNCNVAMGAYTTESIKIVEMLRKAES